MRSVCLHQRLMQDLTATGVSCTRPQWTDLAGLSQVLAFSFNCHLATLALGLSLSQL